MKTFFSIFVVILIAGCVNAQKLKEAQVPASVVAAFHKMYPAVKDYDWEMEDGNYEAEMDHGKIDVSVVFDAAGNLLMTEKEIAVSLLPAGCAAYVSKNYPGTAIREASEITDKKGVKTYEAEVKGLDLIFDANGNYSGQEKDDEEDDDND